MTSMAKFMQTLENEIYKKLTEIANQRGITVQELIRAVIIPEWLQEKESPPRSLGEQIYDETRGR